MFGLPPRRCSPACGSHPMEPYPASSVADPRDPFPFRWPPHGIESSHHDQGSGSSDALLLTFLPRKRLLPPAHRRRELLAEVLRLVELTDLDLDVPVPVLDRPALHPLQRLFARSHPNDRVAGDELLALGE